MNFLLPQSSRISGVTKALLFSLIVHVVVALTIWCYPLLATAIGLRNIEFVDANYDRAILIDFSKKLNYPPGYAGFRPPEKALSLEVIKKREEARRRSLAKREENEQRASEEKRKAEQLTKLESTSTKAESPRGFGKINTAPIKDQLQRLYDAKNAGQLVLPEGKLRVGVTGRIDRDGALTDYKIIIPSGLPDIDRAALAILDAVSESHALGPLHEMSSLTLILNVGERAELSVVGFTNSEQSAADIVNLANAAILYARLKKADDPAAMAIINNLTVSRTGQRIQALINLPRQMASDSLAKAMKQGQKTQ